MRHRKNNTFSEGLRQYGTDGNLVYLLRNQHGNRGAAGRQNRTEGAFVGVLTRKPAVNVDLLLVSCALVMKNRHDIQPKRPDADINRNFDELDAEIEGIGSCFAKIENIKRQIQK
ncbi:MAG: hypothetical protein EGS78_00215 [Bacteroidales bacterium]|nr:hypothetical protein [Bacteroidales bacterium]